MQALIILWDRDRIPKAARYLPWADKEGIMKTHRATKVLVQQSAARLGCRITIQDYRHIRKAIDWERQRGPTGDLEEVETWLLAQ